MPKRAILLFIPGNPGIEGYYTSFFATLAAKCPDLDIYCSPHIGFAAGDGRLPVRQIDLNAQIAHKVDLLEGILLGLKARHSSRSRSDTAAAHASLGHTKDSTGSTTGDYKPEVKVPIYVAGHSVGAYMAIKLLALRHDCIERAYLLFPTLSHIAQSRQGRIATTALCVPGMIPLLTGATYALDMLVPRPWKFALVQWFTGFPEQAASVTCDDVVKSSRVYSALTLAKSEMTEIKEPDAEFWKRFGKRCSAYWATRDGWVSDAHKTELLGIAEGMESHHCKTAPHAFCVRHGDVVAEKMSEWLTRDIEKYYANHA